MPPAESPTQKNSAALPPTTLGQGPRDHQNPTPSKRRLMSRWTPQKGVTWTQRGTTVTPKAGLPTNASLICLLFEKQIFDLPGGGQILYHSYETTLCFISSINPSLLNSEIAS